jgi:fucose permease
MFLCLFAFSIYSHVSLSFSNVLLFSNSCTGPISALTLNCTPPELRVRAFGLQLLLNHGLGDAISPTIIGAVSDSFNSLQTAMFIIPIVFTFNALTWVLGWFYMEKFATHSKENDGLGKENDQTNEQNALKMESESDVYYGH